MVWSGYANSAERSGTGTLSEPITFSVVIPVYNGAAFLGETIDSVLAQTLAPVEILVIEDGSPRPATAVAERYGDRIRYIARTNHGVSASRNFGVSLATGTWVSFLDQDDLWTPDHLERQQAAIASQQQADVCYSDRRLLIADETMSVWQLSEPVSLPDAVRLPQVLLSRCPVTPSSASVRRSTFVEVGGFDSKHDFCEDWDLWLRLQRHGAKFVHVPEATMHYRVLATGNSHNPMPILKANLGVVRGDILPFLPPLKRRAHSRKVVSRLEAEAAILLRQTQRPGALALMVKSILRHPFHEIRRYKIAAHLLLSREIPMPLQTWATRN